MSIINLYYYAILCIPYTVTVYSNRTRKIELNPIYCKPSAVLLMKTTVCDLFVFYYYYYCKYLLAVPFLFKICFQI